MGFEVTVVVERNEIDFPIETVISRAAFAHQVKVEEQVADVEQFPVVDMEKRLLALQEANEQGWVYHVGSLPQHLIRAKGKGLAYAREVLQKYIIPEAKRTGVLSIAQKAGALEGIGMNQDQFFHRIFGLLLGRQDIITLDLFWKIEETLALMANGDVDFDPEALPVLQAIKECAALIRKLHLLAIKTQVTSPRCSRAKLSKEVAEQQIQILQMLVLGHLKNIAKLAPVICFSIDNPNSDFVEGIGQDCKDVLGATSDPETGDIVDPGFLDMFNIVPAAHCCELYSMLDAMKSPLRFIHADFDKHRKETLLYGDADILLKYLQKGGMIGVGVIPQYEEAIERLAKELGINVVIKDENSYVEIVNELEKQQEKVIRHVVKRYDDVVDYVYKLVQGRVTREQIKRQCVPSYLCGFGATKYSVVSEFALKLGPLVSDRIWGRGTDWSKERFASLVAQSAEKIM